MYGVVDVLDDMYKLVKYIIQGILSTNSVPNIKWTRLSGFCLFQRKTGFDGVIYQMIRGQHIF